MKQAWGWLIAGVMAAGLNASYHDGGLQMVHRVFARASDNAQAVLALATGQADQFVTETRLALAQEEAPSCRFATALARVRTKVDRSEASFDRFEAMSEVMSARQEAQMARLEANRARIDAQLVRVRIPAVAFNPVFVKAPVIPPAAVCPRVRVNIPRIPMINAPMVHIEAPGAGPV